MTTRRASIRDESSLVGPDVSDLESGEVIEEVGDRIEVWSRQFVNRWVFLKHQRKAALAELRELLAEAKETARPRRATKTTKRKR